MNKINSISTTPVTQSQIEKKTLGSSNLRETSKASKEDKVSISKIAEMKSAIENGTFKINPEKILDGLIRSGNLN